MLTVARLWRILGNIILPGNRLHSAPYIGGAKLLYLYMGVSFGRFGSDSVLFAYAIHRDGSLSPFSTLLSTSWSSWDQFVYPTCADYRLVEVSNPLAAAI
jgi:hypothetical protein